MPKLNSAPNVCTIGYVKIDYCQRPLHETCEDIDRFAGWATKDDGKSGLAMHGIYLDETPNHYSAERAAYLDALYKHIKSCDGLLGPRLVCFVLPTTCIVPRNPPIMHEAPAPSTRRS